jgi:hypothetical protein
MLRGDTKKNGYSQGITSSNFGEKKFFISALNISTVVADNQDNDGSSLPTRRGPAL